MKMWWLIGCVNQGGGPGVESVVPVSVAFNFFCTQLGQDGSLWNIGAVDLHQIFTD